MTGNARRADGNGFEGWLRGRTDAELAALLTARPDLLSPVPADIGALASRAARRLSLERALDDLDQFALHVIGALVTAPPPVSTGRLAAVLAAPQAALRRCLAGLCARALAWQADGGWRPAPGLPGVIGGPPWPGGQHGSSSEPPTLQGIHNGSRVADQAAAAAALTALRCVEDLLTRWAAEPPPVLRSGGLGIRELRKAAASVDLDLPAAALFTEVARAAGLLAASSWTNGEWLPARAFDAWRDTAPADQWALLADAWLTTTRVPGLVGTRDERGRLLGALGSGLDRMDAPRARVRVLSELATVEPGTSAAASAVLRRLHWRWPRWLHEPQAMLAEMALREAATIGLTGLGALATHGRALVCGGGPDEAAKVLAAVLPEPVSHVLLQGDLTAVAPGPLIPALARELSLAADVESTGGALVYRFSAASVRRAFDAGRSGADLLAMLAACSRTAVPQPLRYLIEDVARRHGRIRVGTASAYIRCDDPAVLGEIAADRRTAALRLRQLAPTVLASSSGRGEVLATLRQLGYAPAAEAADGTVQVTGPPSRRAATYGAAAPDQPDPLAPDRSWSAERSWSADERARAAVRVLRASHS